MSANHLPPIEHSKESPLWTALLLTATFMVAEVMGGVMTGSLALISDAAHMFTDTAALAIALLAMRAAKRRADARRTFGYHRFEILAAAFNALLLFGVALYILFEAYQRLNAPPAIESMGMLVVAVLGLVVNLVSMRLLSGAKDANLNVKGAYLEVWGDMLGSVGVIVGALVIWATGWAWFDSVIAVAVGLFVLPRAWALLKDSLNILLESAPPGLDVTKVRAALLALPDVDAVHELHVWAISNDKASLSVHLISAMGDPDTVTRRASQMLAQTFAVRHVTVQVEAVACELATAEHRF